MRKILILLALLLILQVEAVQIEKTTYQLGEQVYFTSCQTPTLSCGELTSADWEECPIYTFNTADLTCQDPIISTDQTQITLYVADYENNLNRFTQRTETNSLQIARQIYAHSLLNNQEKIEPLLEKLKQSRIERYKCWSQNNVCDLEKTVDILKYLTDSNINRSNRVYQDAMLWVESRQNKKINENFEFYFQSNSDTTCNLRRGTTNLNTVEVNKTTKYIIRDYEAGQELTATCQDNFCFRIRDQFGESIYNQCQSGNKELKFKIEPGCFGRKSRLACSPLITGKALSIKHIESKNLELGKDWVEDNIKAAPIAAQRFLDGNEVLANIYMYQATKLEPIRTWIWYSQNNDGSFGSINKEFITLEAIRTFEQNIDVEWMQDALNYIERTRPLRGYNEIEKETRFYELFSSERLPIRMTPSILQGTKEDINFRLESSAPFNLEVEHSNDVKVTLNQNSNTATGTLELLRTEDRLYTGYITFIENDYEKKVPYSIVKLPELEINFQEEYYFEQESGSINVPIQKTETALNCEITFDSGFKSTQKLLTNDITINFEFELKEGKEIIHARYECNSEFGSINKDYYITVRHYPTQPFTVIRQFNTITDEPGKITIINNIPEEITVNFRMQTPVNDYAIESPITIPVRQEADVFIYKIESPPLNLIEPNTLITSGLGYRTETEFEIRLDGLAQVQPETILRDQTRITAQTLITIILGLIIIGSAISYYNYSNKKEKQQKKYDLKKELEEIQIKEKSKENKPSKELGEVLVAVDKMMGEDDTQVKEDLKQKGFSVEEIQEMLKELEELNSK